MKNLRSLRYFSTCALGLLALNFSLPTFAVEAKRTIHFVPTTAQNAAVDDDIRIATFDSGFGGFFTAKSIETESRALSQNYRGRFSISHYGDTLNAPYGEKTPEEIAQFAARGIYRAFQDGAEKVFIACNTASTQYDRINEILDSLKPGLSKDTVSIIGSSVTELRRQIDARFKTQSTVRVGIFATPATVKAQAYPRAIARAYGVTMPTPAFKSFEQDRWYKSKGDKIQSVNFAVTLALPKGRTIEIYQMGPGNWVDMIEHAAPEGIQTAAIRSDMSLLTRDWKAAQGAAFRFDVVGEFCTHYPVFDARIQAMATGDRIASDKTTYIKQGPLMAGIFKQMMRARLAHKPRQRPLGPDETKAMTETTRPLIFISGANIAETQSLARTIFASDPLPSVSTRSFRAIAGEALRNAR